jgi:phage protein U
MFAMLGEIVFATLTSPEEFRAMSAYTYAEHKVVEAAPRLQWLANDLQKISMKMGFHVGFVNPATQVNLLTAAAEDHQARALVFGNGVHRGYFVIESIEETHQQLADDGSYIAISARVELREWLPGADFDPFAPPRAATPPPGIVAAAPLGTRATPYDLAQPIGPDNLLLASAIVQLSNAGAVPAVTYSPVPYVQLGMSALVGSGPSGRAGAPIPPANYIDVLPSTIVRAG